MVVLNVAILACSRGRLKKRPQNRYEKISHSHFLDNGTKQNIKIWLVLVATYDNLHGGYIWLNGKSDKLTRHTDYFRVNYTVSPSSSLLWLMMTRHYRHGIWNLRKISQKSFNINYWGEGIKILENPYMGTSREVVGRCSCRDDIFFWKLQPGLSVEGFLLNFFTPEFLGSNLWNLFVFEN